MMLGLLIAMNIFTYLCGALLTAVAIEERGGATGLIYFLAIAFWPLLVFFGAVRGIKEGFMDRFNDA